MDTTSYGGMVVGKTSKTGFDDYPKKGFSNSVKETPISIDPNAEKQPSQIGSDKNIGLFEHNLPIDGDPITSASKLHERVHNLVQERLKTQDLQDIDIHDIRANSLSEIAKKQSELLNSVTEILAKVDRRLSDIDTKLNQTVDKVVSQNAPIELLFNEQDLRDFKQVLDQIELKQAVPIPSSISKTKIGTDDIRTWDDINTMRTQGLVSSPQEDIISLLKELNKRESTMAKNKSGWITTSDGTKKHYTAEGILHRNDGPAEVRVNGTQLFYRNGELHRSGGLPAMMGSRGTEKYAVNGKYHRLGGLPAITWSKGPYRFEWWFNGEITHAQKKDGTHEYYAPGCDSRDEAVLHRIDGPAVVRPDGYKEYWINGVHFPSSEQWIAALDRMNNEQMDAELDKELIDEDPIEESDTEKNTMAGNTTTETTKEKKMSKPSFTEQLKANAVSAGYRVAGTQLTTLVKNAILTVMRNKGADGGAVQAFSTFLDTEFGNAMISFAIGSGLNYVPHFSEDPRVVRLAEEMSVAGMATAGNAIIGEAMQHVLPAVSQILQNLPSADSSTNNVRVVEQETSKLVEAMEEEEVETEETEVTATPKTMKA